MAVGGAADGGGGAAEYKRGRMGRGASSACAAHKQGRFVLTAPDVFLFCFSLVFNSLSRRRQLFFFTRQLTEGGELSADTNNNNNNNLFHPI